MKKIIAAFDGLKFSESTMQYAILLAKYHNAHLVGIFLEDITYHSYKIYDLLTNEGVSLKRLKELEEADRQKRKKAVEEFEKTCSNAKINFSVHHDSKIALQELLHESIFADLLVIDSHETLTHYEEEVPSRFIRNLLHEVHCPVILVPKKFKPIDKLVLMYDGTPVSMQAIKSFAYLFPDMKGVETKVLTVKSSYDDNHLPDNKLMKEWVKRHFTKNSYTVFKGYTENEITTFAKTETPNLLFVTGAYRRGTISMWLKRSLADFIMKEIKSPVFIAHS